MNASRSLAFALTVSSAAALAACGPAIRSDRDEAIPIPQGATWMWGPRFPQARNDLARGMGDDIVRQRFERAITAAMLARGFQQVTDTAEAHFLFTLGYDQGGQPGARQGRGGISIGIMGGWGGRGWGRPRGMYPFGGWYGWYDPWAWSWWAPMGMLMTPGQYPIGARAGYREGALVASLRERASGFVAWRGRVAADGLATPHLSQERVQAIVDRLFTTLR